MTWGTDIHGALNPNDVSDLLMFPTREIVIGSHSGSESNVSITIG